MKLGWMKFWLCVSALLLSVVTAQASARPRAQEPDSPKKNVANELTLAGLRPGKDNFAAAEKRYKTKFLRGKDSKENKENKEKNKSDEKTEDKSDNLKEWLDDCRGRSLKLELDARTVIQSVTISVMASQDGECKDKSGDILNTRYWSTGRGLRLGDPRDRIIELYGEPNSSGPSVKGARELELLFYAFDWAGSDVPQVMEVSCDRATGRVLEITLAFPSL